MRLQPSTSLDFARDQVSEMTQHIEDANVHLRELIRQLEYFCHPDEDSPSGQRLHMAREALENTRLAYGKAIGASSTLFFLDKPEDTTECFVWPPFK